MHISDLILIGVCTIGIATYARKDKLRAAAFVALLLPPAGGTGLAQGAAHTVASRPASGIEAGR